MKVTKTFTKLSLRAYVGFRAHMATSRGQGSLEYIAIAIGIVIIAAVAFTFFRTPIESTTCNIINGTFGSGTVTSVGSTRCS